MSYVLDLLFYLALVSGVVVGRFRPFPQKLERIVPVTILTLVAALGFTLGTQRLLQAPLLIAEAALVAFLLIAITTGITVLLISRSPASGPAKPMEMKHLQLPGLIIAALLGGYVLGVLFDTAPSILGPAVEDVDLLILLFLFLVAWGVHISWSALRKAAVPVTSAVLGVAILVPVVAWVAHLSWTLSAAILTAFGWYTLAGPVVGSSAGASIGLLAFLVNFLRENFTMVGAEAIGRVSGPAGITACGGATAMDTTLYFVSNYGGKEAGGMAMTSGALFTLAAPFLLTLFLLHP